MSKKHNCHFAELKERQRATRAGFPPNFGLRIHRMISWIGRAECEPADPAAAFIFLWVAFNAAYSDGSDLEGERPNERARFSDFFAKLVEHDAHHQLYRAVWLDTAKPVQRFIDNRFVFPPFWTHQHSRGAADWKARFKTAKRHFDEALFDGKTAIMLSFLFDRLYMLRNQLIHGGAT